jgi:Flp pilus assembly protein TadB
MARPYKQDVRSRRAKDSATGYSWGGRRKEKQRRRWLNNVANDLGKTGFKRRIKTMDRTEWRKICEVAIVLQKQYSHGGGRRRRRVRVVVVVVVVAVAVVVVVVVVVMVVVVVVVVSIVIVVVVVVGGGGWWW